jgi:uncharacterized protein (TIGR03067 family)
VNLAILALALPLADGGDPAAAYRFAPADDRTQLESGPWRLVSAVVGGQEVRSERIDEDTEIRVTFRKDDLFVKYGRKPATRSRFRLDSRAKTMDLHDDDAPPYLAIYTLERDTLRVALAEGKRPTGFTNADATFVFTFKRVRP